MFTTDSRVKHLLMLAALVVVTAGGAITGRALGNSGQVSTAPELGSLRAEPASIVMMGGNHGSVSDVASASEFIAVVRIVDSVAVKTSSVQSSVTGMDVSAGEAEVTAEVVSPIKGQTSGQVNFKHKAFFRPGSNELDSPPAAPAPEVWKEYLVFVEKGWVAYPLGIYAIEQGKAWFIGFWSGAETKHYPGELSGKTPGEAANTILGR